MTHMTTITGLDVLVPSLINPLTAQSAVNINDIARALGKINRFNGHTHRPYSVAEHSLLVAYIAELRGGSRSVLLAALLHDAHEAYVGDVPTYIKHALGAAWYIVENQAAFAVRRALGTQAAHAAHAAEVKRCDLIALATERACLTAWQADTNAAWPDIDTPGQIIEPLDEDELGGFLYRHQMEGFADGRPRIDWGMRMLGAHHDLTVPAEATP